MYHRVRKVRATLTMSGHRTTIMAFIECTDLHYQSHAASGYPNSVCFCEKILNQGYSNSPPQYQLFHHRD